MSILDSNDIINLFYSRLQTGYIKDNIGEVDEKTIKNMIGFDPIGISDLLNGRCSEEDYQQLRAKLSGFSGLRKNSVESLLNQLALIVVEKEIDELIDDNPLDNYQYPTKDEIFENLLGNSRFGYEKTGSINEYSDNKTGYQTEDKTAIETVQNSLGNSDVVNQFGKNESIQNLDDDIRIATKKRDEWNKKVTHLNDTVKKLRADAPKEQGFPLKKLKKELNDLEFKHMTSNLSEEKEQELINRMNMLVKQIEEREREMSEGSDIGSAISELREARNQAEAYHNQVLDLTRIKDDHIRSNHDFSHEKKNGVSDISGKKTEGSSVDEGSKYYRFTSLGCFWYIEREVFDSMAIHEILEVELFFDKNDPHYGYALLPVTKLSKNSISFDWGAGIIEPDID